MPQVCHSERSVSGVEESSHLDAVCSQIPAKILRLPPKICDFLRSLRMTYCCRVDSASVKMNMKREYLQLNIFFITFHFFSSYFPGIMKLLNNFFFIFPLLFCNSPQSYRLRILHFRAVPGPKLSYILLVDSRVKHVWSDTVRQTRRGDSRIARRRTPHKKQPEAIGFGLFSFY